MHAASLALCAPESAVARLNPRQLAITVGAAKLLWFVGVPRTASNDATVLLLLEPSGSPLVDVAGHVETSEWRRATRVSTDRNRSVCVLVNAVAALRSIPFVTPWVSPLVRASSSELPLSFSWQSKTSPLAVSFRIGPGHPPDRRAITPLARVLLPRTPLAPRGLYELAVLRKYAEPRLRAIPNDRPEYLEARRLLKFLSYFEPIDESFIPFNSIMREFIGGSAFDY